jgi:hypothetical protein
MQPTRPPAAAPQEPNRLPQAKSKEMKMAQKISITKSMNEPREIDNLQITVWFQINGQTYFDYESQGTFNNVQTDGLTGEGGTWNGSQWTGNFLHKAGSQSIQGAINTINKALVETGSDEDWETANGGPMYPNIQITNEDGRAITKLYINVEFSIAGQYYTDTLFLGDFDQTYGLTLTGMGGTLGSNGWWTGNFLTIQYQGVDTEINRTLLTFLNVLVIICQVANVAAAVAGAAGEIRRGFDGGSPEGGGWSLGQQI